MTPAQRSIRATGFTKKAQALEKQITQKRNPGAANQNLLVLAKAA